MRKTHIPALIGAVLLCLSLSGCQKAPPPDASPAPPEPPAQSQAAPDPEPVPEPVLDPDPLPEPDPEPDPEPSPEPASEPEPDPPNTTLYVLMYHHFAQEGELCNDWMVTGARFREDLQWLAGHGYETVLPSQLAKGEPLPRKAVMLTFDDGYISNYGLAYPILQEYGYKAAISVIVSYVEDPDSPYLSWDMCREMVDSGLVEIGSHTYACHEEENGIKRRKNESREDYESRVLTDLQTSIDLIRDNLGVAPSLFAYPNGKTEEWAKDFIRSHFAVTVTTRHGPANISQGLYNLNRCNVSMKAPVSKILPD